MVKSSPIISRYAPTPSGFLHIGNVLNFVLVWMLSKNKNAKIYLRIDDLDSQRIRDTYLQNIFETLDWLDLEYHLGPQSIDDFKKNYSQQLKIDRYRDFLIQKNYKNTYWCACSRKEIIERNGSNFYQGYCSDKQVQYKKDDTSLRVHVDPRYFVTFGNNRINLKKDTGDFIIWRKDNIPSYQLASLIDDVDMQVNLIVRGADLISSTAAQLYLDQVFNTSHLKSSELYFHNLIVDESSNKLSKSQGSSSIFHMKKNGKTSKEVFHLIAKNLNLKNFEDYNSKEDFYLSFQEIFKNSLF